MAHASKLTHGRHLLKVFLTDGVHQAVALDLGGVLVAAYQQHVTRMQLQRQSSLPSLYTFCAGAKVR